MAILKLKRAKNVSPSTDLQSINLQPGEPIIVSKTNDTHTIVIGSDSDNILFEQNTNSPINVVQTTGTSTTDVMSQKAVTDAISSAGGGDMLKSIYDTNDDGRVNSSDEATKLSTGRTLSLSGDATGTSPTFDGTANTTIPLTLSNSGVTPGTYTKVTTDSKGRVTSGTNPTTLSGYGITDATPSSHIGSTGISQHGLGNGTNPGFSTNDYTTTEKTKLSGIQSGAEVNVQSDWNQTNTTADDYIKNKPVIGSGDMLKSVYDTNDDGKVNSADEADKLSTPRTISISGAIISSTPEFDGTSNIELEVSSIDWSSIVNTPTSLNEYGITDAIPYSEKGVNDGVSTLDSNGKVPLSQINDVILGQVLYGGVIDVVWGEVYLSNNAKIKLGTGNTTIFLTNDNNPITGYGDNEGIYYIVFDTGGGSTYDLFGFSFQKGDWLISTGSSWQKVGNTDAVRTVNGRIGDVVISKPDWNQTTTTAEDYIKNKPILSTVATSGSYNDLTNKPITETLNTIGVIQSISDPSKTFTQPTINYIKNGNIVICTINTILSFPLGFVGNSSVSITFTDTSFPGSNFLYVNMGSVFPNGNILYSASLATSTLGNSFKIDISNISPTTLVGSCNIAISFQYII